MGLLLAGLAFLYLAIDELHGFATGKDSLLGDWLGDTQDATDLKAMLLDLGAALKDGPSGDPRSWNRTAASRCPYQTPLCLLFYDLVKFKIANFYLCIIIP